MFFSLKNRSLYQINVLNVQRLIFSLIIVVFSTWFPTKHVFSQPLGDEFQVNVETVNDQHMANVAMIPNGEFVVTWAGASVLNNAIVALDPFVRLYNADGTPKGPPINVFPDTLKTAERPVIAADSLGNFVIVWECESDPSSDDFVNLCAQRFSSAGQKLGSLFQVNTMTSGFQRRADMAMTPRGDFIVVWESLVMDQQEEYDVYGQRFLADGTKLGQEFLVNEITSKKQRQPAVDIDQSGNFGIVWNSEEDEVNFKNDILGRFYSSLGVAQLSPFKINSFDVNDQIAPDISISSNGDFVVAWQSAGQLPDDKIAVYGQRFTSSFSKIGEEFRIDSTDQNNLLASGPSTAIDKQGNYIVTWTDFGDGDLLGVSAQCFSNGGDKIGNQIRVNSYVDDLQFDSKISMDAEGNFVIVWTSANQESGPEGMFVRNGVFGKTFQTKFISDCNENDLLLSGIINFNNDYSTTKSIESEHMLSGEVIIRYSAKEFIQLNQGFEITNKASLSAIIDDCSN